MDPAPSPLTLALMAGPAGQQPYAAPSPVPLRDPAPSYSPQMPQMQLGPLAMALLPILGGMDGRSRGVGLQFHF